MTDAGTAEIQRRGEFPNWDSLRLRVSAVKLAQDSSLPPMTVILVPQSAHWP